MSESLKWIGLDGLIRRAHGMARPITKDEAVADLLYAVEPMRDAARRLAPRAPRPSHGPQHAAETITMAPVDGPAFATVAVGPGPAGWYLRFAELGTSKQAARPWLRPAFDANLGAVVGRLIERLGARLRERAA
jgi:HK97 gp10 family phage protein